MISIQYVYDTRCRHYARSLTGGAMVYLVWGNGGRIKREVIPRPDDLCIGDIVHMIHIGTVFKGPGHFYQVLNIGNGSEKGVIQFALERDLVPIDLPIEHIGLQ